MAKTGPKLTYIYIVDQLMLATDDIRNKFRNELKYNVRQFPTQDILIKELATDRPPRFRTRIAVFVEDHSNSTREAAINRFVDRIKSIDSEMNIIVLAEKKEKGFERKLSLPSSFTLVHKNPNAILRITNHIMGIISKENLERKYTNARRSVQILFLFILAAAIFTALAYLILPEYF